jgi:hypothetical protein
MRDSEPVTREQWQEALLDLLQAILPAIPGPDLAADFEAALRTAQARLAGDLREAWALEARALAED